MSRQIYEVILDFKLREPNPYGYPLVLNFRYNTFQKTNIYDMALDLPVYKLYVYMLEHLNRHNYHEGIHDLDDIIAKCCTVEFHPNRTGVHRQHIHVYLSKLVEMNLLTRVSDRGYEYYVNPYYYNVLSRDMARHAVAQLESALESRQYPPLEHQR